ncbi:MAG: rod-binding protein [bacterium]
MINPINLHQDILGKAQIDSQLDQLRQMGQVNNFADQLRQIQQEEGMSEPKKGEKAKLLDLCYKVESMLVYQMVKGMRSTIHKTDFLEAGMAEDIFQDMLDHHRAEDMSKTGNFGLAKQLYAQLSRYL